MSLDDVLKLGHPGLFHFVDQLRTLGERAYLSPLTQLPNKVALRLLGEQFVASPGPPPAVAFMDLTGFKRINDAHGHSAGDAAIARAGGLWFEVANACAGLPFHVSGDEFVMLIPSSRVDEFKKQWRNCLPTFEFTHNDTPITAAANCGLAVDEPDRCALSLLQDRAESACRAAKGMTATDVVMWDAGLQSDPSQERRWRCAHCGAVNRVEVATSRSVTTSRRVCLNCNEALPPDEERRAA